MGKLGEAIVLVPVASGILVGRRSDFLYTFRARSFTLPAYQPYKHMGFFFPAYPQVLHKCRGLAVCHRISQPRLRLKLLKH